MVFSLPKQYSLAVKQSYLTRQKSAFAKGTARGQELSEAALKTLGEDTKSTPRRPFGYWFFGWHGNYFSSVCSNSYGNWSNRFYSPPGIRAADVLLRQRPEI